MEYFGFFALARLGETCRKNSALGRQFGDCLTSGTVRAHWTEFSRLFRGRFLSILSYGASMELSYEPLGVHLEEEKKGDPSEPSDHALGRSRGGYSTKLHLLCDVEGHPLSFYLTPGQTHESTVADVLLETADNHLFDLEGIPVPWPAALAGDKGYRADWIDTCLTNLGISPVIPSKSNENRDSRQVPFSGEMYRKRNIIERLIGSPLRMAVFVHLMSLLVIPAKAGISRE